MGFNSGFKGLKTSGPVLGPTKSLVRWMAEFSPGDNAAVG